MIPGNMMAIPVTSCHIGEPRLSRIFRE